MLKPIAFGLVAALACGRAATAASDQPELQAWVITPGEENCHIDLDLAARSGAVTPVALVSDGAEVWLRFSKDEIPARAFLPIRVDQKPYANLVTRTAEPKVGLVQLSEETQAALRKGALLQVGWLGIEPLRASLGGSEQAIPDLKTCGAQVAGQRRAQLAAEAEARARAEAEARAKEIADAQLAAARAQQAREEAERQRIIQQTEAEAETRRRQAEEETQARADADAYARRGTYDEPFDPRWRRYDPYERAPW